MSLSQKVLQKGYFNGEDYCIKEGLFRNLEPERLKFMAREILILLRLDHPKWTLQRSRSVCEQHVVGVQEL